MIRLSQHFMLSEFTNSQTAARLGINNIPTGQVLVNLQRTASVLEKVRTILGGEPIHISSGYRSPELNAAAGGSDSSAHMTGLAVDFIAPTYGTPLEICRVLEPYMQALRIDQLIHEWSGWVHLGLREDEPRCMAMTIDSNGIRTGFA
jgi:hypothetical protein